MLYYLFHIAYYRNVNHLGESSEWYMVSHFDGQYILRCIIPIVLSVRLLAYHVFGAESKSGL